MYAHEWRHNEWLKHRVMATICRLQSFWMLLNFFLLKIQLTSCDLNTIQIQEILFHSIIHNWIFNFVSLRNRNFAASNNHLILYCALIILHSKLLIAANVKLVVIYSPHQIKIVPGKFHGFPFNSLCLSTSFQPITI